MSSVGLDGLSGSAWGTPYIGDARLAESNASRSWWDSFLRIGGFAGDVLTTPQPAPIDTTNRLPSAPVTGGPGPVPKNYVYINGVKGEEITLQNYERLARAKAAAEGKDPGPIITAFRQLAGQGPITTGSDHAPDPNMGIFDFIWATFTGGVSNVNRNVVQPTGDALTSGKVFGGFTVVAAAVAVVGAVYLLKK